MAPPTMQAAVMHQPGDIRIEEVPVPRPGPGQALVRVAACGICGSDIARMLRKGAHRMPIICGHEFSGHIVEVGAGLDGHAVGDLVTVPPLIPDFTCAQCAQGRYSLCEDYDYFGSRSDGAYTEYVVVPASNLFCVPDGLDPVAAAMADPAAIALHAVWRAPLRAGARVAVVGAGPIGLFAIQWARLTGAREVLAVDLVEENLALAETLGAKITALGAWNSFSAPFPGAEWRVALDAMAAGELRWKEMITHDVPLVELPDLLGRIGERSVRSAKVIVRPPGNTAPA